jgi:hypothetical protein
MMAVNKVVAVLLAGMVATSMAPSAEAGRLLRHLGGLHAPFVNVVPLLPPDDSMQLAQQADSGPDVAIPPSQAADIAQSVDPSARVIKVKLLPSGVYAVILKGDGKLTRVMVDAQTGNIL